MGLKGINRFDSGKTNNRNKPDVVVMEKKEGKCLIRKRFTNFAGYKHRLKAFILSLGIIWLMILVEVVSYGR